MIIAVCIDSQGGMLFNHRRLSRDRVQLADLLEFCNGRRLWIAPYSAPLFPAGEAVTVDADFLDKAGPGEVCFVEDRSIPLDRAEALVVYCWNRSYPSDVRLDIDPKSEGFLRVEQKEFQGSSHERITREFYQRRADHA